MASFEKFMGTGAVFKNVSVLSPHYVPKHLLFREKYMDEVMTVIAPVLKGQKTRNLIIYGKTGTGKTCTIKKVMEEFEKMQAEAKMHYLNCRIYNSRYRIFQKVMKDYYGELEKPGFGLPFFYEKMIEKLSTGHHMIIVLDEIDMTKDLDELVYTLTRANDEIKDGSLTIIGISNKIDFKDTLDPRSKSSLHEVEILFPSYTTEQLQKILEQRIQEGFQPGVVKQAAVNLAAAMTAQESGDARYALKLLLRAGEMAEQQKKKFVEDKDVEDARRNVEIDLIAETINTLPEMHRIVLHAVATLSLNGSKYSRLEDMDQDFLMAGEVYDEYERVCRQLRKKPRSLRWYKEYINDLEMLGLITTTPSSKGIRGQTTLIKLGHDAEGVQKITSVSLGTEQRN